MRVTNDGATDYTQNFAPEIRRIQPPRLQQHSMNTSSDRPPNFLVDLQKSLLGLVRRGRIPTSPLVIGLAAIVGILGGYGAAFFTFLIESVSRLSVEPVLANLSQHWLWSLVLMWIPAFGLLAVAWFTRRFAPEAQGHGVPEVILAVGRNDGRIRPRVSVVKVIASGVCIGTGGSIGREGPIVQIGSSLGSVAGQWFKLSAPNIKVLVAAGAAAGISATFNAPLAGVMFASEIILGNFNVESLTPIVVASVLADVVQKQVGEHGENPAFGQLHYAYLGVWEQIPSYFLLGLLCGLAAVSFTKLVYAMEDISEKWIPKWWQRAIVAGLLVGAVGVCYPLYPPFHPKWYEQPVEWEDPTLPPLFGVGYEVVRYVLHLEVEHPDTDLNTTTSAESAQAINTAAVAAAGQSEQVHIQPNQIAAVFLWLLPLFFLKPLLTSLTLAGGGSGGIFAPSLYIGATAGGCFGLACNYFIPSMSANPGVYAIVGMGAVVAGTTHGVLSAILIVYEMTGDYRIILPIMLAAGLSSIVARFIDPESIYYKKLSRRGELIARGHDMTALEHIMVRDVMLREFPTVHHTDNLADIVRVARQHSTIESLPVMNDENKLVGIIRPEDLHLILDSDISPHLVFANDIALKTPLSVRPSENLLEALRDFGTRDIETLPVESGEGENRRLVGLLLRSDVMRRYREEMLRHH